MRDVEQEHTHPAVIHTHDHHHVTHHYRGSSVLGDFEHRSVRHGHEHNHSVIVHRHRDRSEQDEREDHEGTAHVHDHESAPPPGPSL